MINKNKINISVVIPILNEAEILQELYRRLTKVMEGLTNIYELIFIDDGSKDESFKMLNLLHENDKRVKVIKFSRNFGHHIAITAGLDHARGEAVVLMDGDLQDPPEEIPKLYEKFKQGYDIVYTTRTKRKDPFLKKLCSKIFFKVLKIVSDVDIPPNACMFRIISQPVVQTFKKCHEKTRLTIALIDWTGFSHIKVKTVRNSRYAGKSKYSFSKSTRLAIDGITSFSHFPLHIATYTGFIIATISIIIGIYMLIQKLFFGMVTSGYASLIVSIMFLSGVQLTVMGILGEYIGKIYKEVQNRPLYVIEKIL